MQACAFAAIMRVCGHRRVLTFPLLFGLILIERVRGGVLQVRLHSTLPSLYGDAHELHDGQQPVSRCRSPHLQALAPWRGPLIVALGLVGAHRAAPTLLSFRRLTSSRWP
ncbi:hypothetical protein GCM10018965_037100 [Nonomuraea roseola]